MLHLQAPHHCFRVTKPIPDSAELSGQLNNPRQAAIRTTKRRLGKDVVRSRHVLDQASDAPPVRFAVLRAGEEQPVVLSVAKPATISSKTPSSVTWAATSTGGIVRLDIVGQLDLDSYLTFAANISALGEAAVNVTDIHPTTSSRNLLNFVSPNNVL